MKTYRVSAVERFRQFEQDDAAELDDLIADLTGQREPSTAMQAGSAFHAALEHAEPGSALDVIERDAFRFVIPDDLVLDLPAVRELRAHKVYRVDGAPVAITGQVDAIDGRLIVDHKTTARFDPERYLDGCQWRLYLDIFGADRFRWNVFELAEVAEREYEVRALHRVEQHRYPALAADCQALVERFTRFARRFIESELHAGEPA